MRVNNSGPSDTRKLTTGKDGALYAEDGTLLATMETYQSQTNFSNASYQPLGDAQEHAVMTGYKVTLNFTECVIESSQMFQELFDSMQTGVPVRWTFQGVQKGLNGTEERIIYRDCVPDGSLDLQNVSVGDIYKRQWSTVVNRPPELQKLLSSDD